MTINKSELLEMLKEGKMNQREMADHFGVSKPAITKMKKRFQKQGLIDVIPDSLFDLNEKERIFAVAVAGGKTQTQAAREAYPNATHESAKSMGYALMKKNDIKVTIAELMQSSGLTRTLRVEKLVVKFIWRKNE